MDFKLMKMALCYIVIFALIAWGIYWLIKTAIDALRRDAIKHHTDNAKDEIYKYKRLINEEIQKREYWLRVNSSSATDEANKRKLNEFAENIKKYKSLLSQAEDRLYNKKREQFAMLKSYIEDKEREV